MSDPNFTGNWFQSNGTGVQNDGSTAPAVFNYWGSPTGPKTPMNPGGQGDPIFGSIIFKPFLTSPPDSPTPDTRHSRLGLRRQSSYILRSEGTLYLSKRPHLAN